MSPSQPGNNSPLFWLPNPFTDAAVGSVWEAQSANVPGIHAGVFQTLLQMVRQRRAGIRDRCALLYGNPGSGKTHLIRRLRFALQSADEPPAAFSWARMQTSPAMMWRHLRRTIASNLVHADLSGRRQIEHLLNKPAEAIQAISTRDLAVVIEHLAARRYQRDARAWLMGDRLPEPALQMLGVANVDPEEESLEDESRRIVQDLAQLLHPVPLVLCLDQLEALQSYPGDKTGLFAIGNLMAALHDEVPNAVVIGCVQTGLIGDLQSSVSDAAKDRYRTLPLHPLKPDEIRSLVLARLQTQPEIAKERPVNASEFWPIDIEPILKLAASPEGVTARKVIFECDRMFQAVQGATSGSSQIQDDFFEEEYEQRLQAANRELKDSTSSEVLSDGLPRLFHLLGISTRREGLPRWKDHVAERPGGDKIGVVVANEGSQGLWRKLDKIAREWNPRQERLILLRDNMNPLSPTARATHARLAALEKSGARVVLPSREALLALDALRRLLADAESGDLAFAGDSVSTNSLEAWIRKHMPETLSRLIDEICPAADAGGGPVVEPATNALLRDIAAHVAEQKVVTLMELAKLLNRSSQEIEHCVRENPDSFGFAGGTEAVVFERVPVESGA